MKIFRCNPFVILNIFISNCNLITQFFLVTVTNYNYFYFVINYVIPLHVTSYSPTMYIYIYIFLAEISK